MANYVHVESIEALDWFSGAYRRFVERLVQVLEAVDREFRRRWEYLEQQYYRQQARVQALQEELERAEEEEERREIYARLQEEQRVLSEMRFWLTQLRAQYESYRRQAKTLKNFAEEKTPRAIGFLKDRVEELKSFLAVPLPGETGMVVEGSTPEPSFSRDASLSPKEQVIPPPEINRYALPDGFQWIPLSDIATEDLPSDEEFVKVSKDEIRQAFERLPEVLELLQDRLHQSTVDNSLYFMRLDRRAGRSYPEGLQRVFEAFFGSNPIVLERSSNRWIIMNGRHRVRVAIELGWTAVPARVKS